MSDAVASQSLPCPTNAAPLSLLSAFSGLFIGGAAIALGVTQNSPTLYGLGGAYLVQVPLALSLWGRVRSGLGNRGLERELKTLRLVSYSLRLIALGLAAVSAIALLGQQGSDPTAYSLGLAAIAVGSQALLWKSKQPLVEVHPSLALDAARTRTLLELAAILLAGSLLGRWFPLAEAATGLVLSVRLYFEGRSLAILSAFKAACGGCGTGCGC